MAVGEAHHGAVGEGRAAVVVHEPLVVGRGAREIVRLVELLGGGHEQGGRQRVFGEAREEERHRRVAHRELVALAVGVGDAAQFVAGQGHPLLGGLREALGQMPGDRLGAQRVVLLLLGGRLLVVPHLDEGAGELAGGGDGLRNGVGELAQHDFVGRCGGLELLLVEVLARVGELLLGDRLALLRRDVHLDVADVATLLERRLDLLGTRHRVGRPRSGGVPHVDVDEMAQGLGQQARGLLEVGGLLVEELHRLLLHHHAHEIAAFRDGAEGRKILAELLRLLLELLVDVPELRHVVLHQLAGALDVALDDVDVGDEREAAAEPQVRAPHEVLGVLLRLGEQRVAFLARLHALGLLHHELGRLERRLPAGVGVEILDREKPLVRGQRLLGQVEEDQHLGELVVGLLVEGRQARGRGGLVLLEKGVVGGEGLLVLAAGVVVVRHGQLHRPHVGRFGIRLLGDHRHRLVEFPELEHLLELQGLEDRAGLGILFLEILRHERRIVGHPRFRQRLDVGHFEPEFRAVPEILGRRRPRRCRDRDPGRQDSSFKFRKHIRPHRRLDKSHCEKRPLLASYLPLKWTQS